MKRIPNKTAVRTICYGLRGDQYIAIYDYPSFWDLVNNKNGELVCDGVLMNLDSNYRFNKFFESEYHGLTIEDGTIVFHICTAEDQYK